LKGYVFFSFGIIPSISKVSQHPPVSHQIHAQKRKVSGHSKSLATTFFHGTSSFRKVF
jgi:hypothetical protein